MEERAVKEITESLARYSLQKPTSPGRFIDGLDEFFCSSDGVLPPSNRV